jgi:hypothetical protein
MLFISSLGHRIEAKTYEEAKQKLLDDLGIIVEVA